MKRALVPVMALLVWGHTSLAGAQCAMCKTALTNSPEGRAISGRFNVGILVMLLAPYVITTGVLFAIFREPIGKWLEGTALALRQTLRPPRTEKNPA